MKNNQPVTQNETDYPAHLVIVTRTDTKGVITYANDEFVELSGFTREELVGKSHNMVRHPDMPPVVFKGLWDTIKSGYPWRGLVKNRCKNGDYYWVKATVVPIREDGHVVGYMSVRKKPSRAEVAEADQLYRELNSGKKIPGPSLAQRFSNLSLKTKLQFLIQPTLLILLSLTQFLLYESMKDNTLKNARAHAESAANEVIDGANMLMLTGSISDVENRKLLLRKFSATGNIKHIALVRSKAVADQFGPGLPEEQLTRPEEISALDSKKPGYWLEWDQSGDPVFRAVTPYIASKSFHGGTNCLQCHEVPEGTVVGVSNISIDLKDDFARLYQIQMGFAAGQVVLQVILFFFIGWAIEKFVRRPLGAAMQELERVVNGDLSGEIDVSGRNEMGSLLCSIQSMQTQLGVMIDRISGSANDIEARLGKVITEIGLLAKQSENQSESAVGAASAMEQISASVAEVASNASDAALAVSVAHDKAGSGNQAMANSVATSNQVVSAVTSSAETIARLEAAVTSIGSIADTIKGIADQTNLLALNAAIEAARAGEQGRGFAVVADEVRKLAEKTAASTADIGRTVSEVTGITQTAADEMRAASVEVGRGMQSLLESAESLKEIAQQSLHAMDMANHIAVAVKQQAVASEDIAGNLSQISQLSGSNTDAAWRAEQEAREVGAVAGNLQQMVGFFKL